EKDITDTGAPYIVKSPWLCDSLDRLADSGKIVVDHAIIPVRDLRQAAASRIEVTRKADPTFKTPNINGGLWGTINPGDQQAVLAQKFCNLMFAIRKHDIPRSFLNN